MTSYLLPYVDPRKIGGHEDPMLEEFTYGDAGRRGKKLREKVKKGDFLFFHTSRRGKRVITAYYVVERVMPTEMAKADELITSKYRNPHLHRKEPYDENDTIVFGDPIRSRVLKRPFVLTPEALSKLSKPPKLNQSLGELAAIAIALKQWKQLSEKDVELLLSEIRKNEEQGFLHDTWLSTQEIEELDEADIEQFVWAKPHVLGNDVKVLRRQYTLKSGKRVDLLLEDKNGLIVVEIKKGAIGRDALKQIKGYLREVKEELGREVRGVIICGEVLPAFEDSYMRKIESGEVEVYLYSWMFGLRSLSGV